MLRQLIQLVLRVLAVLAIGFVSAVTGLVLGAVIGGNLAGIYELISGVPFVFNGREGYEATGQIGFMLGGLAGFAAGAWALFARRAGK